MILTYIYHFFIFFPTKKDHLQSPWETEKKVTFKKCDAGDNLEKQQIKKNSHSSSLYK